MKNSQLKEVWDLIFEQAGVADLIVCAAGLTVLAIWFFKTSFGKNSLIDAPNRRNDMPVYTAIMPVLMWITAIFTMVQVKKLAFPDLPGWKDVFANNMIYCLGGIPSIAMIFFITKIHFARGIKGFGLNVKTAGRDLKWAFVNFLAVMPIVLVVFLSTILIGKLIAGSDFEIPKHEELKELTEFSEIPLKILIIISATIVAPFTEEMLFRGMLQTVFRSYLARPWLAIILASFIFVICHPNFQHWPALFALSMCLGYSYEKSGSLFRSIFIHAMFNALNVFSSLTQ